MASSVGADRATTFLVNHGTDHVTVEYGADAYLEFDAGMLTPHSTLLNRSHKRGTNGCGVAITLQASKFCSESALESCKYASEYGDAAAVNGIPCKSSIV